MQNDQPMAFHSGKLSDMQMHHTTTEREILAMAETSKEFRNILSGQKICVHTDHENLAHENFNVNGVMRWCLVSEECGPKPICVKGEHNAAVDTLSRLDSEQADNQPSNNDCNRIESFHAECLMEDKKTIKGDVHLLNFKDLQ